MVHNPIEGIGLLSLWLGDWWQKYLLSPKPLERGWGRRRRILNSVLNLKLSDCWKTAEQPRNTRLRISSWDRRGEGTEREEWILAILVLKNVIKLLHCSSVAPVSGATWGLSKWFMVNNCLESPGLFWIIFWLLLWWTLYKLFGGPDKLVCKP